MTLVSGIFFYTNVSSTLFEDYSFEIQVRFLVQKTVGENNTSLNGYELGEHVVTSLGILEFPMDPKCDDFTAVPVRFGTDLTTGCRLRYASEYSGLCYFVLENDRLSE